MSRRGVSAVEWASMAVLLGAALQAAPAAACSRILPEPFEVDSALDEHDGEAPEPFRNVVAVTHRIEGERCVNGVCTMNSCGDAGVLELRFKPPAEAAEGELGYRLVWLGGDMPAALQERLDLVLPLPASTTDLSIELGWNSITELNGELALVAVDRAGNESEPSAAARVVWSGCTDYYGDQFCLEETPSAAASQSCSAVRRPAKHNDATLPAAVLFGLLAGYAFRARRPRSAKS